MSPIVNMKYNAKDLEIIKEWILKQPHLPQNIGKYNNDFKINTCL